MLQVAPGGPVGPDGTLSPFISDPAGPYVAGGPVGPYGTLSPSDSEPAGSVGPYVAGGPVGPDGTLSPFISDPAGPDGPYVAGGPVGPYGTLSPSDYEPAGSVGPYVAGGPVGPLARMGRCPRLSLTLLARIACMLQVALLARMGHCPRLTPVLRYWWTLVGCVFPDPPPGGTLLLGEGPGSCQCVPTNDLVSVAAVPLPAARDPMVAWSPVKGLIRECDDVTEESITVHGGCWDPCRSCYGGYGCLADKERCSIGLCGRRHSMDSR